MFYMPQDPVPSAVYPMLAGHCVSRKKFLWVGFHENYPAWSPELCGHFVGVSYIYLQNTVSMKIHGICNIQTENETDGTVSLWDTVHEVWVDRHM